MKFVSIFKKQENPFLNATMIYLIIMTAFVGVRIFGQFGLLKFLGDFEDLAYSLIIQVGIIFGLTLVLYKMFTGKSVKTIFKEFVICKLTFEIRVSDPVTVIQRQPLAKLNDSGNIVVGKAINRKNPVRICPI